MKHIKIAVIGDNGQVHPVPFDLGDTVKIDGEVSGIVIGIAVHPTGVLIQVSWWNAGTVIEAWFADWRLEADEKRNT